MSKQKRILGGIASYGFLCLTCIFVLAPIGWFLVTSLKTKNNVLAYPPQWIPNPLTFEHYRAVIFRSNMPLYFLNSLFVGVLTIILSLCVSSLAGYITSRFNFKGKNLFLSLILGLSMIPGIAILPALYTLAVKARLHDTYIVLILVFSAWKAPELVWMLKGFFDTIPKELEEAAIIDGCSQFQAFYKVILPVSQPGLAACSVFVLVYVWNNWLISQALTITERMRLVPVGLYNYIKETGVEWGRFTAYTILAIIPVLVIFLLAQTRFIQGLTSGAQKG